MTTSTATRVSSMDPAEFRVYNRLVEQMDYYHSVLRTRWNDLYAGTAPHAANPPSASRLIEMGLGFCQHLGFHHDIEEAHYFPVLGRKMEGFRANGFAKQQHEEMHRGLDVLAEYLGECKRGEKDLQRKEVRTIMESFGVCCGGIWTTK
ncbi:hypothetical protein H2203_007168 [Taxawa tesnikishii (nom. ined.)]|nr:hypothetical protein H2203_007168 [Dothideales sp. JES 119]